MLTTGRGCGCSTSTRQWGQGDKLERGQLIGTSQDIAARYGGGMVNHCHLDVQVSRAVLAGKGHAYDGEPIFINPLLMLEG